LRADATLTVSVLRTPSRRTNLLVSTERI